MKSLPYSAPLIIAGVALALSACSADGSAPHGFSTMQC